MYNPRWPHTFRVVVESLDSNGLPVTDANGDPVVGSMQLEKIVYDSAWNPTWKLGPNLQSSCGDQTRGPHATL